MTQGGAGGAKILRAYVDETGDRGFGGRSSKFFALACVLIADEDQPGLYAVVQQLRKDFGVPSGAALHWKDHVKTYPRRQRAADLLTALQSVRLVYVLFDKASISGSSIMRTDQVKFYNYAAQHVLERALYAARDWPGGSRELLPRFGHVRRFPHHDTTAYFNLQRSRGRPPGTPWHVLHPSGVHFDQQVNHDGLQAADAYAGMLSAAFKPDEFSGYEHHHFLKTCGQMQRDPQGSVWGWGFKLRGSDTSATSLPWWPPSGL